ncbi:hypothetical protein CUMW_053410 [Citrus unshiu]|nr:hypothetical protein CUMW_053410 [Citrus unshiu]
MAAMVDSKPAASVQGTPLLATATLPVFTRGIYSTKRITLETSSPSSPPPPKPLIYRPRQPEKGTFNQTKSFRRFFDHIASHRIRIVVAPQLICAELRGGATQAAMQNFSRSILKELSVGCDKTASLSHVQLRVNGCGCSNRVTPSYGHAMDILLMIILYHDRKVLDAFENLGKKESNRGIQ